MKKTFALLSAITLIASSSPLYTYAEENTDLNALASSLGADTDYINVANYKHDKNSPWEAFEAYTSSLSAIELSYKPSIDFSELIEEGSGVGISALEVLSHNEVIKPSDIKAGAESLSEISYNSDIDQIITRYQFLRGYSAFNNYDWYQVSGVSSSDNIANLIKTAENSMKENRYFLISIHQANTAHSVCGIGIADGSWEWNGEKYDKCILTLDSNAVDSDGNAKGFSEENCIYINSGNNNCYLPAYGIGTDDYTYFSVIDDDTLLNYRGVINPSGTINTDVSGIKHISANVSILPKFYTVSEDGTMTEFKKSEVGDDIATSKCVYKTDSIHIDMDDETLPYPSFRYESTDRWIDIEMVDTSKIMYHDTYDADIDISDNNVSMKATKDSIKDVSVQIRTNGNEPFSWNIATDVTADGINIEVKDNGILLTSDGHISADVSPVYYQLDENGNFLFNGSTLSTSDIDSQYKDAYVVADNNVFVCVENQELVYYIDKDGDGAYTDRVEKGDINCDGFIDATDASMVLEKYASYATNDTSSEASRISNALADFNGDGLVDAIDVSEILGKYGELSTAE